MWAGHYLDDNGMGNYTCPLYCAVEHKHFSDHEGLEQETQVEQSKLLVGQENH